MKEFNLVIIGTGGQGILTLASIIAKAAMKKGYDVKTSELHGLAQRGGTVPCHVRFGDRIYSPLVREGEAHLIIALELLESLRACYYASKRNGTVFLINSFRIIPVSVAILKENYPSEEEVKKLIKPFAKRIIFLNASQIAKRETGMATPANVYMLAYACSKKLIPIEKKFFIEAMEEVIPKKYLEINRRIFEIPFSK